jgi:hypothetical protein
LHADAATPAETLFRVGVTREAAVANPTLAVEPTSTTLGRVVAVSGTGLGNDQSVPIHLVGNDGSKLTVWTAATDATGAFNANVLVPVSVSFGTYTVHVEGVAPAQTLLTVGRLSAYDLWRLQPEFEPPDFGLQRTRSSRCGTSASVTRGGPTTL